jgi:hypothetical protein
MKQEERKEQIALIKWARMHQDHRVRMLFHIPNGGKRDIVTASYMKKMGVLAGVPDLFLPVGIDIYGTKHYHGLFIEMKSWKGKQSKCQIEFMNFILFEGYDYTLCNSWVAAAQSIEEYLDLQSRTI